MNIVIYSGTMKNVQPLSKKHRAFKISKRSWDVLEKSLKPEIRNIINTHGYMRIETDEGEHLALGFGDLILYRGLS